MVSLLLAGNYKQLDLRKVRWVLQDHVEGQVNYMNQSCFSMQMMEKYISQKTIHVDNVT